MASPAASPIFTKASVSVAGPATMSPDEFLKSSQFKTSYPRMRVFSTVFLAGFTMLLVILLGFQPPQTESGFRRVTYYAGYFIFIWMWLQIYRSSQIFLSDVAVNNAVALFATEKINEARRDTVSGVKKLKVEDLQQFFPNNRSEPAMLRLLVRIWQDAMAWRFDSLTNLIAPYQRESLALRIRLENLQRVSLRLGILGAFVGLILALKDLQHLAGSGENLVRLDQFLPGFLSALYLKFGASIGGLGASLFGFTMASLAEKEQARYFRNMEGATGALLDLASRSLKFSAFVDEFGHIRSSIRDLQNEVHNQAKKTDDLAQNVGRLATLGSSIGTFTSSLEKEHSKFLSDMQRLYDQASMERVFKSLEASIIAINKENQTAIGKQFLAGLGTVNRDFGEVRSTLKAVEHSVAQVYKWTVIIVGGILASALIVWFLFRR